MSAVKRIRALTIRNIREIVRDPLSLIFLYGLPILMEVLFYFLFHSQTDQFEMRYLAPGMIAFSHTFITLFLGILLATDRSSMFMVKLYTTGIRSYEFILSYAIAMLPIGLSQSVLLLVLAGIIDSGLWSVSLIAGLGISILVELMFIGFGLLFGSLCNEKAIGGISSIVTVGQSVLSGMWFPTQGLDRGFVNFMNVLPFRNASSVIQNIIMGVSGFDNVAKPALIVLAYTIAVYVAAVLVYRHKMKQ